MEEKSVTLEVKNLSFTYPGLDGQPPRGAKPLIQDFSLTLRAGDRCLLVGSNGAGKTTILKLLGGKHMVEPDMIRVLGRSAFHDTSLISSGLLCYLGGEVLGIDLKWRMHKVSDGQRRRVQICMGLLQSFQVLLLDEITVDLDVLARADLLTFLKNECKDRGATIVYATHIFDGLADWPSHIAYVAHGKLQLALPLKEVDEMKELSLMRTVEKWLRKEKEEKKKRQKERKAQGLPEFEDDIEGSRDAGDPARVPIRLLNNGWAGGRLHSTLAGEDPYNI
ncbi:ABC transporter I family member 20 isoform X2 [Cryptomeria japonica]|uniref:ABC transporter I family member 20 isoform X2 n=1 Tax=Cryptomeria japonica TaxID=3369 RepID=UPI0027DA66BE|nr:ABC transporter I family member 20 isoform X2 [Cryptomeria japonica]